MTSQKCTTRLVAAVDKFKSSIATALLSRAGHVYALGTAAGTRIVLYAALGELRPGAYTLTIRGAAIATAGPCGARA